MVTRLAILCVVALCSFGNCFEGAKEPPIAARKRDYKIVALGEDIQLLCPITGHAGMTWSRGNEFINDYAWERFSFLDKKSLMISKVQLDDTGIYYCKGTNGFGSAEVRIDLFVVERDAIGQNAIKPILTEETRHITESHYGKIGSDLFLFCAALGQPEPSIYWLKNNRKIDHTNGLLELKYLTKDDSGVYTCYAQNAVGITTKNFTVQVVNDGNNMESNYDTPDYSVISHLTVPNNPENTTVEQGGSATLECKAKGRSTWLKKLRHGEIISTDMEIINLNPYAFVVIKESSRTSLESKRDVGLFTTILTLQNVSPEDAGMYICIVDDNQDRSMFKYTYLHVQEASGADPQTDSSTDPLILVVACLGAFVLVFLILIIVCICKRNGKPNQSNQSVETPEIREKMLDQQVQVRLGGHQQQGLHNQIHTSTPHPHSPQMMEAFPKYHQKDYYTQNWINHPKMGLPLPPTPYETGNGRYQHESNEMTKPRSSYRR